MTEPQQTAIIHIQPDVDPRVIQLYQESVRLLEYAESRIIQSPEDIKTATDDLALISNLKKAIEERRKEYIGPINSYIQGINDVFKKFGVPLAEADTITRGKILAYRSEQERIRQEEERINRLRVEAAQAEMRLKGELTEPVNLVPVAQEAPSVYRTEAGTLGTAKTWHFEVVDFAVLPDQYKIPNDVKIRKAVIAGVSIPGVRAWQEESLRVKG